MNDSLFNPDNQPITLQETCAQPGNLAFYGTGNLAFYGRFSSDLQRDTSIEDQLRQCRQAASRLDRNVPDQLTFSDEAISGTSAHNRPGLQNLIRLAKRSQHPLRELLSRIPPGLLATSKSCFISTRSSSSTVSIYTSHRLAWIRAHPPLRCGSHSLA